MRKVFVALLLLAGASSAQACTGLLDYQFTTLQGQRMDLCEYQDRPILIVNTASKCGFTPQFEKLEAMYERYKAQGLLIVGFPSNDFKQELATNKEIGDFCKRTYDVQFPMAAKSSVVGPDANELYQRLAAATHEPPLWNFHKYLILPGKKKIYAFSSDEEPASAEIMSRLEPYLK
jgi:glutathione peroxidase